MEEKDSMKKMMKCLVLAMAVLAVAGSAWCWDFADHVKMAPNGQGDILLYPFFAVGSDGWETKITVINTSPNRSVVAHIVFYSAKSSIELTDFFLFLTPTDVWIGTVKLGSDGKTYIYSQDDSALTDAGAFATKDAPLNHAFLDPLRSGTCTVGNPEPWGTFIGYMKVLELAHSAAGSTAFAPGGSFGTATYNLNNPGLDKKVLKAAFDSFLTLSNGDNATTSTNNGLVMDGINVLSGNMEFRNSISGMGAIVPATTMRDYDNQLPVGYTQSIGFAAGCGYSGGFGVTGAAPTLTVGGKAGCQAGGGPLYYYKSTGATPDGPVNCNPAGPRGATLGSSVCSCYLGGVGCQTNSLGEVEAALAKDWIEMPVTSKSGTVHILTFPTKQTGTGSLSSASTTDCYIVNTPSPFFNEDDGRTRIVPNHPSAYSSAWESWGCVSYMAADYDLSENSASSSAIFSPSAISKALCAEVNLTTTFAFDEGWTVYSFGNSDNGSTLGTGVYSTRFNTQANLGPVGGYDARYTGAPVIATSLYISPNGGLTLAPSSWADGEVKSLGANGTVDTAATTRDDVVYNYYQYWDFSNTNGLTTGEKAAFALNYASDEWGCCIDGAGAAVLCSAATQVASVPCGISTTKGGGLGSIYSNKFSGNRAGVLANAQKIVPRATTVFVPSGAIITATPALAAANVGPAPYTFVPANGVATTQDTMVTIPAGTTILSSVDLMSQDSYILNSAASPQPFQAPSF